MCQALSKCNMYLFLILKTLLASITISPNVQM